jgi:hypothetical protein
MLAVVGLSLLFLLGLGFSLTEGGENPWLFVIPIEAAVLLGIAIAGRAGHRRVFGKMRRERFVRRRAERDIDTPGSPGS